LQKATTNSLPAISVAATTANAAEGTASGVFTFTRTGSTNSALTVNFTASGTATAGSDYTSLGASVTIPAGVTTKTLTVSPIDDAQSESSETVVLTLASGAGYTNGTPNVATVTIADNDTTQGSNPTNPVVKLKMVDGKMVVSWNSVSGQVYQVCYKSKLTNTTWTPLGSPVTATGPTASYTDNPIPVGVQMRFYNVRVN
jgi:hypothetical protein